MDYEQIFYEEEEQAFYWECMDCGFQTDNPHDAKIYHECKEMRD